MKSWPPVVVQDSGGAPKSFCRWLFLFGALVGDYTRPSFTAIFPPLNNLHHQALCPSPYRFCSIPASP